jgi:nucleoid DNA-binding protein
MRGNDLPGWKKEMGASHPVGVSKSIDRLALAEALKEQMGMPSRRAQKKTGGYKVIDVMFNAIIDALAERKRVFIRGFGEFYVVDVKSEGMKRIANDSPHRDASAVPDTLPRVYFVPSEALVRAANDPTRPR